MKMGVRTGLWHKEWSLGSGLLVIEMTSDAGVHQETLGINDISEGSVSQGREPLLEAYGHTLEVM